MPEVCSGHDSLRSMAPAPGTFRRALRITPSRESPKPTRLGPGRADPSGRHERSSLAGSPRSSQRLGTRLQKHSSREAQDHGHAGPREHRTTNTQDQGSTGPEKQRKQQKRLLPRWKGAPPTNTPGLLGAGSALETQAWRVWMQLRAESSSLPWNWNHLEAPTGASSPHQFCIFLKMYFLSPLIAFQR